MPHKPTFRIELATAADLPGMAEILAANFRAVFPGMLSEAQVDYMLARFYTPAALAGELANGRECVVLRVDGAACAFASYGPATGAGELQLRKLYVGPDCHGRGYGAALLDHVLALAAAHGYKRVMLAVNRLNQRAISLYRRYGFEVREAVCVDIGGGFVMDDYIMVRSVGAAGDATSPPG